MKNETKILTRKTEKSSKYLKTESFSRLFSFASRSFLVCFSFTLRSNFASDRFIPRIFLAEGPPSCWADLVLSFPKFTNINFKIIRLNFPISILNYRARPPRCR